MGKSRPSRKNKNEDGNKQQWGALVRAFGELERDFKAMQVGVEHDLEKRFMELAGPDLEVMKRGPEETVKYLDNPNPRLREVALHMAYHHWEIKDSLASVYERMASADPDADVRETAVGALGTCYARTKNLRIGRLLAVITRDASLADSIRLTAFTSLLRLHGNMEYGIEYGGKSPLVPVALEQVDWAFVDKYYTGSPDQPVS